jgi:hypothetical protein
MFKTDTPNRDTILVNPDHVRTAQPVAGHRSVRLVMGGDKAANAVNMEGDLDSVLEILMGRGEA